MEDYDFTLIRWTTNRLGPDFDYFFPEKERFLPALYSLGIRAKVIDTSKWETKKNPFKKIVKEIKTDKVVLTLSEWAASKDYRNLIEFIKSEKKELYILVQAEENKTVQETLGQILLYTEKAFVTLEKYKETFARMYPQFREKFYVLPYPVQRGRIFNKEEARKILDIQTPYVLICWGCPRKVKQFDKVLKWIKNWSDTSLLIAGSLEEVASHKRFLNSLKRYVKENKLEKRVFFSENMITHEDVDIWFSAADLKVYPHSGYACASVTYAIGHGKCVVTNAHPNFKELSKQAGIVPSKNFESTIRNLLDNPQERTRQERKSLGYSKKWNWFEWTKKLVKELNIPIKKPPKVAVIIPVKNVEKFIIRHLENWKNLCYPKDRLKLYFMDGYSTDRTRELIEKYCKQNKINYEIHLEPKYNNPINASGWIANTMRAFRKYLQDEEYVAIVDADIVYWNPFLLGQLLIEDVDIIAPYVYTEPTGQLKYDTKSAATRYFYDCTLFRRDNYLFPKKVFWKQTKGLIEMDSVGSFVLVKREVYDNCYWDNPLPTLQFLLDARKLGYRIWTKPKARVFHRYFTNGHKSIEQHVKEGRLPKSVLAKVPNYLGFLPRGMIKKLSREKTYTWQKLKSKVKKGCPACLSKNLFIEHGRVWCRGCGYNLGTDVEKYFSKPNVLIIVASSLRYDYFMRSKVPRLLEKGLLFKCSSEGEFEKALNVLLSGLKSENLESNVGKSKTAWDIFKKAGYTVGYINLSWKEQSESELLKKNYPSHFRTFPRIKNLRVLLENEPFFGVLHFWSTFSPYGLGDFPRESERVYKEVKKLLSNGKFEEAHKIYEHGVRGFEKQMKALKEILEKRNLLESTLIVITSDYGESLSTKEENVPLLFYHPSFSRIHLGSCSQEDILPSILKLIGIEVSLSFDGKVIV